MSVRIYFQNEVSLELVFYGRVYIILFKSEDKIELRYYNWVYLIIKYSFKKFQVIINIFYFL